MTTPTHRPGDVANGHRLSGDGKHWRPLRDDEQRAEARRDTVERLAVSLSGMGGKYRKALQEGRFASFSLIGTESWEDYAGLPVAVLSAQSLANIESSLGRIETLLGQLVEDRATT